LYDLQDEPASYTQKMNLNQLISLSNFAVLGLDPQSQPYSAQHMIQGNTLESIKSSVRGGISSRQNTNISPNKTDLERASRLKRIPFQPNSS
jgi:hypothetical protein